MLAAAYPAAAARAAFSGEWKASRIGRRDPLSSLTSAEPTVPPAPVIRIMSFAPLRYALGLRRGYGPRPSHHRRLPVQHSEERSRSASRRAAESAPKI